MKQMNSADRVKEIQKITKQLKVEILIEAYLLVAQEQFETMDEAIVYLFNFASILDHEKQEIN